MTESHATDERDRRAWVAPLISTPLTLCAGLFMLAIGALSPMACDSCFGGELDRFESSFEIAWPVLLGGLVASAGLLVASWCLPWRLRYQAPRVLLAVGALVSVPVVGMVFYALVSWPKR